jgi:uncharacterized protein (TIGR00730 family)
VVTTGTHINGREAVWQEANVTFLAERMRLQNFYPSCLYFTDDKGYFFINTYRQVVFLPGLAGTLRAVFMLECAANKRWSAVMKAIGIFCGSSAGENPIYLASAKQVGKALAQAGLDLVYGGGKVGLMGAVADAALEHGGRVIGVMPRGLVEREISHTGLSELHVVDDMHERKSKMSMLADGFIAMPGGAGTLEEISEQWTWAQLGIHEKPCAFLNVNGYYNPLQAMAEKMAAEGFMHRRYAEMLTFSDDVQDILTAFHQYAPPQRKWLEK